MRSALRIPATMVWLTVLWVLLWGDVSFANVVGGVAVSAAVVVFARLDSSTLRPTYFRPGWALLYVVSLGWHLLVSNLRLAYEILTPGDGTHSGIIAVPMRGGSDAVLNLISNSITLTPGTMTIDVKREDAGADDGDGEPRSGATLYVHGMFTQDVEAVRHEVLRLEASALRAFGSPDEYAAALADVADHEALLTTDDPPELQT